MKKKREQCLSYVVALPAADLATCAALILLRNARQRVDGCKIEKKKKIDKWIYSAVESMR